MDYENFIEWAYGNNFNLEENTVWICDYRLGNRPLDKPIRHVKPMEVKIISNSELPKNKRVYYSNHHFRPLNKNGTVSSRIIPPYDTTGYRGYTGVSLNIFINEKECRNFYKKQCEKIKSILISEKNTYINKFDNTISEVEDLIKNNC